MRFCCGLSESIGPFGRTWRIWSDLFVLGFVFVGLFRAPRVSYRLPIARTAGPLPATLSGAVPDHWQIVSDTSLGMLWVVTCFVCLFFTIGPDAISTSIVVSRSISSIFNFFQHGFCMTCTYVGSFFESEMFHFEMNDRDVSGFWFSLAWKCQNS